ncbi:MAG: DUF642 domain-containing protein [Limisphaerales bacterium]
MNTQQGGATAKACGFGGSARRLSVARAYLAALLTAGVVLGPTTSSAQGNLVFNGSFESANLLAGWTGSGYLTNGGWAGSQLQCPDGHSAAGLAPQASIYQDVPTVVGQQYDFSFYMAAWGPNTMPPTVVLLSPSFGAASLGTVSFSSSGQFGQDMGWEWHDYTVTATTPSTRIMFLNTSPTSTWAWDDIDEVSVTVIPEPSCSALLLLAGAVGLWGGGLGRLRSGRRNSVLNTLGPCIIS